ncbi:hypothetical protein BDF21DRAFT_42483 [Thamnidium elegans]|nr:hypothetical protein BDF21DRAFT_42483 [Thamnidium elegans]
MTMETIDDGFKHIEQGVSSTHNIIRHFKKAEKALKVQEETIVALKAKLAVYQSKDKSPTLLSNKDNTTTEAISNLQREVKNQKRKMQELSRENEDIKKENEKLKSKMNVIHTSLLTRPITIDTKNQTKIPRPKKRSNPFRDIERRFSYTGTTNLLSTTSKKKKTSL